MMMMDGQDYVNHGEGFYHKNHFFSGRIDYQMSFDQYQHFEIFLNEELNRFAERSSSYVNGRIRLHDADGRVLADSGLPQPITRISIADKSDEKAVKFTPPGGQVNVKLYEVAETVGIRVSDTGIGIPEDNLPHLFSRFHRARNAAAYPGSLDEPDIEKSDKHLQMVKIAKEVSILPKMVFMNTVLLNTKNRYNRNLSLHTNKAANEEPNLGQ